MGHKEIYVETSISAPIDEVWKKTQNPSLHEQWDIRFSSITYLPKIDNEPQKFTYTRSLFPGLEISGWGISVGNHEKSDGTKSSSLHFGTPQKISPIREGRGYWQYIPKDNREVTFLTSYNYETNFGRLGKLLDTFIFRPLMGWGTALSFDILKRWIEKGESPSSQYMRFLMTYSFSLFFAFVWIFHGLVPKIIAMHPEELMMTGQLFSIEGSLLQKLIITIGFLEITFGLIWLFYPSKRHLFIVQCVLFPILMLSAIINNIQAAMHPFSPITFNLALILISIIGFLVSEDTPTAKSCSRRRASDA